MREMVKDQVFRSRRKKQEYIEDMIKKNLHAYKEQKSRDDKQGRV